MKKIFTRSLALYMVIALLITIIGVFAYQTYNCVSRNTSECAAQLAAVESKLSSNDDVIAQITSSLGDNALAKARAFADILAGNPEIAASSENLIAVCDRLMVSELNIIDGNGIIVASSVSDYYGFDMSSGDQSAAFMVILDDPSVELVQEPQENVVYGKLIQYIGVARKDAPGFVQVGVAPEVLTSLLASTATDVVLSEYTIGKTGYIFAVNTGDNTVAAIGNPALVGVPAADAGFPDGFSEGSGTIKLDGVKGHYLAENYEGYIIGTFYPSSEYYSGRLSQTAVVVVCMIFVFLLLMGLISSMVSRKIVAGITRITDSVSAIAGGNLNVVINENSCPEYRVLSDSINSMTGNTKQNLSRNDDLMNAQRVDMEHNREMVDNVSAACNNLKSVSDDTVATAHTLMQGAEEQNGIVAELKQAMAELIAEINRNGEISREVAENTKKSVDEIRNTGNRMNQMSAAMQEIADQSEKIAGFIGEIDSIASTTNLLSLNASIEAARAGEQGKSFAVVATEVGELAARSTQAAKETADSVSESLKSVEHGKAIAELVAKEFTDSVNLIEMSGQDIEKIAEVAKKQSASVEEVSRKLQLITEVIDRNFNLSKDSELTAERLAEEAEKLRELTSM